MPQTVSADARSTRPLKVGAGGWITGLSQANDGTLFCRADTYGGYKWDGSSTWSQLVTASGLPAGDRTKDYHSGIYEVAVAPSDSSKVYAIFGASFGAGQYPYYSTDGGVNWTKRTASPWPGTNEANDSGRYAQKKMAVDPINPDVVYACNGVTLYKSFDAGVTWSACTGFTSPTGGTPHVTGICIDPSSSNASTPTRKSVIWAFSRGVGMFRSTDGGLNWSAVAGGPGTCSDAAINANGVLLVCDSGANKMWRYSSGAWTDLGTPSNGNAVWSVAFDPNSVNRAIVVCEDGRLKEQTNVTTGDFSGAVIDGSQSIVSTTIPWMGYTAEQGSYWAAGGILFSKTTSNLLYFSDGLGVWKTTIASGFSSVTWTNMSDGIEQLVATIVKKFSGNRKLYLGCLDRGLFTSANPETYAAKSNTPPDISYNNGLRDCFSVDAAVNDSQFIVALLSKGNGRCSKSTNGGDTWTEINLPAFPYNESGGFNCVNVSSGSATVTVNQTSHGLSTGWYIAVTRCDALGGITPSGRYSVTVVNANQFTFTHGSTAGSTATNAGGNFRYAVSQNGSGVAVNQLINNGFNISSGDLTTVYLTLDQNYEQSVARVGGYITFWGASTVGGLTVNGRQQITAVDRSSYPNVVISFKPGGTGSAVSSAGGTNVVWMLEQPRGLVTPSAKIAVSTSTNWVLCYTGSRGGVFYTTDAGVTWNRCAMSVVVDDGNWAFNYYVNPALVADPNQTGRFYIFHRDSGFFESTDSGANWTRKSTATLATSHYTAIFSAVPGKSGHFFWACGNIGSYADRTNPQGKSYFSTDYCATWTELGAATLGTSATDEIKEVDGLSFGPTKPGKSYPRLWIKGYIDGDYGVFYTDDMNPTVSGKPSQWYKTFTFARDWLDNGYIWADPDSLETLYGTFSGAGWWYTTDNYTAKTMVLTTS